MNFFNPTNQLKELKLLQHIEKNPETTQKEIASVIDAAPSMVNVYIDDLEEKGYMERDYKSAKVVTYNITQEGTRRKNYLAVNYFQELLKLYRLAECSIERFLFRLEHKGYKNILIYGAGEVAETILRVINSRKDKKLKVLALIDDNEEKIEKELLGYKIISKEELSNYNHDAIAITSYTYEEEIICRLKKIGYPNDKIERFFTD